MAWPGASSTLVPDCAVLTVTGGGGGGSLFMNKPHPAARTTATAMMAGARIR
jgi:hypothetical protein